MSPTSSSTWGLSAEEIRRTDRIVASMGGNIDLILPAASSCFPGSLFSSHARSLVRPIHAGPLHVQQDDGKIELQDEPQRVLSGLRDDDVAIRRIEQFLQGPKQLGIVFDDQDVTDQRVGHFYAPAIVGLKLLVHASRDRSIS